MLTSPRLLTSGRACRGTVSAAAAPAPPPAATQGDAHTLPLAQRQFALCINVLKRCRLKTGGTRLLATHHFVSSRNDTVLSKAYK